MPLSIDVMAVKFLKRLRVMERTKSRQLSALEQVTQTYELLEHILDYLDPHSLRQAHLVAKYWHSIVHKSSMLAARTQESRRLHSVRAVLIGVNGAGKDTLVNCLLMGPVADFTDHFDPCWEPSFRKQMIVDDERWLIDGTSNGIVDSDQHTSYVGHCLANSETYILIYSTSSRHSFDEIKAWVAKMNSPTEPLSTLVSTEIAKRKNTRDRLRLDRCIPAAVVSTKNDFSPSLKEVDPSEGAAFARELGCAFIETSAKTGDGVEAAFAEVCRTYKRAKVAELLERSRRTSLLGAVHAGPTGSNERRERWWRWYRTKEKPA